MLLNSSGERDLTEQLVNKSARKNKSGDRIERLLSAIIYVEHSLQQEDTQDE